MSVTLLDIHFFAKVAGTNQRGILHHQTFGRKRGGMVPATPQVMPPAWLHVPVYTTVLASGTLGMVPL
jgi:hypothetical protein